MSITDYQIPASELYAAMRAEGINAVTTVPDLIQFALHDLFQKADDVKYIECSAENQALTTAMGLFIGGMTPMVMMQNQGLFNCLNTLRSVGIDAQIPMVLSVGAFGREVANLGQPTRLNPLLQPWEFPTTTWKPLPTYPRWPKPLPLRATTNVP